MKTSFFPLVVAATLGLAGFAAAGPKTYQVTGPVLAITDDTITVQKGDEKWEVARDKGTKVNGELKVGVKVTIEYTMSAVNVDAKAAEPKSAGKPAKKKK
jgi:hypothetical protein